MSSSTAVRWDQSIWGQNLFAIPPEDISFTYKLNTYLKGGNSEAIIKDKYLFWQLFCKANTTHNSNFSSSLIEKIGHPTGDQVVVKKMYNICLRLQGLFTKVFDGDSQAIIAISLFHQIYFHSDQEVLDCALDKKNKVSVSGSLYESHVKTIFHKMIELLKYDTIEEKTKRLVVWKKDQKPEEKEVFHYAFPVKAAPVTAPFTSTSLSAGISP